MAGGGRLPFHHPMLQVSQLYSVNCRKNHLAQATFQAASLYQGWDCTLVEISIENITNLLGVTASLLFWAYWGAPESILKVFGFAQHSWANIKEQLCPLVAAVCHGFGGEGERAV